MEKKKIIFVQFAKFLDFHYQLYEIEFLKKNFSVEAHDLSYIFDKKIHKKYYYLKNYKKIKIFFSLREWIKKIIDNKKKYGSNLYLFYVGSPLNFRFIIIHLIIILKKINFMQIKFNVFPLINIYKNYNYLENLKYKFNRLIKRFNHVYYDFKSSIINKIIDLCSKYYPPKYVFCCGSTNYKILKKLYPKSNVISLNSWEGSKFFIKYKSKKLIKKFGIYLSSFTEKSVSDSSMYKYKRLQNTKNFFLDMNYLIKKIEKKFLYNFLIALHPRSEKIKKFKLLGSRPSFYNNTHQLIKYSSLVIIHSSLAVAYAVLYFKPILFVATSEDHKNLYFIRFYKKMAKFFGSKYIAIKDRDKIMIPNNILKVDTVKYKNYIKKYLTSKTFKNIPNYKIFEIIFNNKKKIN